MSYLDIFRPTLTPGQYFITSIGPGNYDAAVKLLTIINKLCTISAFNIEDSAILLDTKIGNTYAYASFAGLIGHSVNIAFKAEGIQKLEYVSGTNDVWLIDDTTSNCYFLDNNQNSCDLIKATNNDIPAKPLIPDFSKATWTSPIAFLSDQNKVQKAMNSNKKKTNIAELQVHKGRITKVKLPNGIIRTFTPIARGEYTDETLQLTIRSQSFYLIDPGKDGIINIQLIFVDNNYWLISEVILGPEMTIFLAEKVT